MSQKIATETGTINLARSSNEAVLAHLMRCLPLSVALQIVGDTLAVRSDLDGRTMQIFQRQINDICWPLVTIDEEERRRVWESV